MSPDLIVTPVDPQPNKAHNIRARERGDCVWFEFHDQRGRADFVVCTYYARVLEGLYCPTGKPGTILTHNKQSRRIASVQCLRRKDIHPDNRPPLYRGKADRILGSNPWCWLVHLAPLPIEPRYVRKITNRKP